MRARDRSFVFCSDRVDPSIETRIIVIDHPLAINARLYQLSVFLFSCEEIDKDLFGVVGLRAFGVPAHVEQIIFNGLLDAGV